MLQNATCNTCNVKENVKNKQKHGVQAIITLRSTFFSFLRAESKTALSFSPSPQIFELWIIFQSIPYYRMLLVLTYWELHTPLTTLSIVSAQTSWHVGVGESNRNQLASFATANWWNFAYLGGNLWRKNDMLEQCNFEISMPIPVLISIKI